MAHVSRQAIPDLDEDGVVVMLNQEQQHAQDNCLITIADENKPLNATSLMKLPPYRAWLIARVAQKAGVGLEFGTVEQLQAEAERVGGNGKLGQWWVR